MPKSGSRSSSKKAQKTGSNVFDMFTQKQVAEMKEGFQIMDSDKDGILGMQDLRNIFDEIGRIATDEELQDMINEADGPLNFTQFLNMFAEKNKGEVDDDAVIKKAFMAYVGDDGSIDCENFRHALMTWGDKFSAAEVDDTFQHLPIDDDDNTIDPDELIGMMIAGTGAEE
uniref:Myosin regulatory light chain 2-like n=1 Tax=Hirondellea gigas TaxID=1518452 RepID=A0A2P2HX47_9CRUS